MESRQMDQDCEEAVWREICIFQAAQSHDNVVKLVDVLEGSNHTNMVMELVTGGNLLSRVVQAGVLNESTTKRIARSILNGLLHLHQRGIYHNDLQPSNILLDGSDNAKIADFGNAQRADDFSIYAMPVNHNIAKNVAYTAPEVFMGIHANEASDMWSVGALLYFSMFGCPPFTDRKTGRPSMQKIQRADYAFPASPDTILQQDVSRLAKQLISSLLHTDPTVRLTAAEALQHPWLLSPLSPPPAQPFSPKMFSPPATTTSAATLFCTPPHNAAPTLSTSIRSLARKLVCRPFRRKEKVAWKSLQSNSTDLSSLLPQDLPPTPS